MNSKSFESFEGRNTGEACMKWLQWNEWNVNWDESRMIFPVSMSIPPSSLMSICNLCWVKRPNFRIVNSTWPAFSFTNCERNPDFGIVELWVLHYARICFVGLAENRACKAAPCERWQRGDVAALHRGPSIPRGWVLRSSSLWAAKKRFEISKFKFKFPRARAYELIRARSRLHRSPNLQGNSCWN